MAVPIWPFFLNSQKDKSRRPDSAAVTGILLMLLLIAGAIGAGFLVAWLFK